MNEPIHYPAFLKAYPKILGIELVDIWWMSGALIFLLCFEINPIYILIVIFILLGIKILCRSLYQRKFVDLWLRSVSEMEWAHLIKFGGKF